MPNTNIADTHMGNHISPSLAEIRTYLNYNRAWAIQLPFGCTPIHAQSTLPGFQRLQRSKIANVDEVKRHLTRGKLTLDLIGKISIDENPDFARVSALWLPVQTYYAVNGFGLAVLAARKGPAALPKTHRAFLSEAASNFVQSLFPKPYSAMLKAGYRGFKHLQPEFVNIKDVRTPIRSGFNLESPDPITGDAHIAQCLDTTRRNEVERRLDEVRKRERKPGKKYRVLSGARQKQLVKKIGPTSILDYLYRARIKSNYEDVTMYQEGDDNSHIVLELVESTQLLATKLCTLLLAVLWRLIDKSTREKLKADVELDDLVQQIHCV